MSSLNLTDTLVRPTATSDAPRSSDGLDHDTLPTSFGLFKPVGWVMVGLPTQAQADAALQALHGGGWPAAAVVPFTPRESVTELEARVSQAGPMAGFGYEITLLRRYLDLAREGYRWLLVKVDDNAQAAVSAEIAQGCGATLAIYYRRLTVEELI